MQQIFPIFNSDTKELIGYKERNLVHAQGYWHKTVQANVLRKNAADSFDILVQKRSAVVDIGMRKFDQSLATHMLDSDNLDDSETLRRGLFSELGIHEYRSTRVDRDLRIIKTYKEHPNTLNREIVSLFLVEINGDDPVVAMTSRIERLFWMQWSDFLKFFAERKEDFTKTAQFYFGELDLLRQIEDESLRALSLCPSMDTERQSYKELMPLLRIDRYPASPKTYCGDITRTLSKAGELGINTLL
jgi:hypothetical protein